MRKNKMTINERLNAPSPKGWTKASQYAKLGVFICGIVAAAVPPAAIIVGVIGASLGAFSFYCSTRVNHDELDTITIITESPEIQDLINKTKELKNGSKGI